MYTVVGCGSCGTYWLLSDPDDQESATCARCGTRHRTDRLKRFYESAERAAAAEARAKLLADKRDETAAFERAGSVADLEREVEAFDGAVDDREYLERSGVDPDAVAAAGADDGGGSRSREEIVRDALRAGNATEEAIVGYATDRGVPTEAARDLLDRLTRRGEATESRGQYRLL
ncbi:replication protein H [Halobacteriales archaeon QS_6_71_20]|nr:MAG: replication protein H [Halobacteriales archaeon QS_6_71_20]